MARFAPVVPTDMAASLQQNDPNRDALGSYQLLLAHDIIDRPEEYQEIYGRMRAEYNNSFIILDNSIIELGKPMDIKDLLRAAEILTPDCLVVPDVMGDGAATREKAVQFTRDYAQEVFKRFGDNADAPPLMGVLQGETVEDALETLGTFYALPMVDFIGIPRILTKQHGSRMHILNLMGQIANLKTKQGMGSFKGFHLLGFSDDVLDDIACARVPWIQGIDSNVPVRAGYKGIAFDLNDKEWSNKVGPRGDFWNVMTDAKWREALPLITSNLSTIRRSISLPRL